MKYCKYLAAIFSLSFFNFSSVENNLNVFTTNCHQVFHFFFLGKGEFPVFWIGEDISGECESSKLINISIKGLDVSVIESVIEEYENWNCIPELNSHFRKYEEIPMEFNGKVWKNKDLKIFPPDYDPFLAQQFNEHIHKGGNNAYSWIKIKGKDGIILPKIEGVNTELLYCDQTGLYINYEISEIHYFPKMYIIIFINQPVKAVGLDTMHGFFIFKINNGT